MAQVLRAHASALCIYDNSALADDGLDSRRRFCVATYPGVQERLAGELAAAGLLLRPGAPALRDMDFGDIFNLPILDAVRGRCCCCLIWLSLRPDTCAVQQ